MLTSVYDKCLYGDSKWLSKFNPGFLPLHCSENASSPRIPPNLRHELYERPVGKSPLRGENSCQLLLRSASRDRRVTRGFGCHVCSCNGSVHQTSFSPNIWSSSYVSSPWRKPVDATPNIYLIAWWRFSFDCFMTILPTPATHHVRKCNAATTRHAS